MSQLSARPHAASAIPVRGGHHRRIMHWLLALLATTGASASHAVVHCVDANADGDVVSCAAGPGGVCSLRAVFSQVEDDVAGSRHEIRIPAGNYAFSSSLRMQTIVGKDDKSLAVSGGWDSTCTTQSGSADATVLDGTGTVPDANFGFVGRFRELIIENLTLRDFGNFLAYVPECEGHECHDTRTMRLRGNRFEAGHLVVVGGYDIDRLSFSNNLAVHMSENDLSPVYLIHNNNSTAPDFSHNTFADIDCQNAAFGAVRVYSYFPETVIHHNIVQSQNCGGDFDFSDPAPEFPALPPVTLSYNLFGTSVGREPIIGSGNRHDASPGFVNAAGGNYRLGAGSPAINVGMTVQQSIINETVFPDRDLDGVPNRRVVGDRIDLGAYESSIDNAAAATLVVSNNNDSGTGSLRAAVTTANALSGLQRIVFDIPGNCPQLIRLQTPLPDVTDDLEIDGYTQPGARANTRQTGSDAELCVGLVANGGTLSHFLQVPQTAAPDVGLVVKGIAFIGGTFGAGNSSVQLRLRGGRDHLIAGNAFGGIGPGAIGDLGAPNFGIQIRESAQHAWIGGPLPEHRNSFGNMQASAIVLADASSGALGPHVIQNNYIGLAANGYQSAPIAFNGIAATDSPSASILDNVVTSTPDFPAIVVSGATATGYRIANNVIGADAERFSVGSHVYVGLHIKNGSGGHLIGDDNGDGLANLVFIPTKAGIWIADTAGNGNRVRKNIIVGPGVDGSGALAVDLGALGALPNDANDADAGPNRGQNAPVLVSSLPGPSGAQQVPFALDSVPNATFVIDFYRAWGCANGSLATPSLWAALGQKVVSTDAAGHAEDIALIASSAGNNSLIAIATNLDTGDSSEPSACLLEAYIFADGFD